MTEAEWDACTQVDRMLKALDAKKHRRKWVLFNCACCRRAWGMMPDDACRAYVEAAERYALGAGLKKALSPLRGAVNEAIFKSFSSPNSGHNPAAVAASTVTNTTGYSAWSAARAAGEPGRVAHRRERQAQADLLREIVGNPFRPVPIDPACLTWNGGLVRRLAQAIYDEAHFGDLGVLADALEEAGCDQADLLTHLRGPGAHVRGCWAVDLILGKS